MATNHPVDVIEVAWTGPHTTVEVAERLGPHDRGLLAYYGTHPVFGPDALLYLDEAREVPFGARVARVGPWLANLPSEPTVYIGRLGGTRPADWGEWLDDIQRAFRLAVFFHSPPWNAAGVNHHGLTSPTLLLNVGRRHRLALEVSTFWDQSAYSPTGEGWTAHAPEPPEL